jgi:hypothetical protein
MRGHSNPSFSSFSSLSPPFPFFVSIRLSCLSYCIPLILPVPFLPPIPRVILPSVSLRSNSRGHGVRGVQRRRKAHHTGQPPGTPLSPVLLCFPTCQSLLLISSQLRHHPQLTAPSRPWHFSHHSFDPIVHVAEGSDCGQLRQVHLAGCGDREIQTLRN